jgi:Na+-driven multidrug efflux pump
MSEIRSVTLDGGAPPDAAERLGVEPVGKLLLKFSIPAVAGMLLNALYNVVDRVFVGQGVDELALGGLSHCTRAQGFPMISMIGMIIGAGLNMILDPIFIFALHWGVEGAAFATIISQFASALWMLYFNTGKRGVIRLKLASLRPSLKIILEIMSFGAAQFLLQFAMSSVQLLLNTSMGWYGVASLGVANGGDIAISGMNIVGTVSMLILMPVFGLNQGSQPVLGFNYGAKKFARVRKAYLLSVLAGTSICTFGFLMAEIFPRFIVSIFVSNGSAALVAWTEWALRVSAIFLALNGFQVISTNMFVFTGRIKISILLSMSRQVIFLVPAIFILGKFFGTYGAVAAIPVADGLAIAVTSIMIFFELKKLNAQSAEL